MAMRFVNKSDLDREFDRRSRSNYSDLYPFKEVKDRDIVTIHNHLTAVSKRLNRLENYIESCSLRLIKFELLSANEIVSRYL